MSRKYIEERKQHQLQMFELIGGVDTKKQQ